MSAPDSASPYTSVWQHGTGMLPQLLGKKSSTTVQAQHANTPPGQRAVLEGHTASSVAKVWCTRTASCCLCEDLGGCVGMHDTMGPCINQRMARGHADAPSTASSYVSIARSASHQQAEQTKAQPHPKPSTCVAGLLSQPLCTHCTAMHKPPP